MIEKNCGHWHLDYYCEKTDFYTTATGFWNDEGSWDVFFNELEDEEMYKLFGSLYSEIDKDLVSYCSRQMILMMHTISSLGGSRMCHYDF